MRPERSVDMGRSIYGSGVRESTTAFCLGHPPHPVQAEEVICRTCGSLVAGTNLGIYQVQQLLGRGRNGSAYLAMHLRSKQLVVIKLFPPDLTSRDLWERARREVRIATALRHSSILPVFSSTIWQSEAGPGTTRPLHELMTAYTAPEEYLLTLCQYVPGTLQQFLTHYEKSEMQLTLRRQGISPLSQLISLIQQAGEALSAGHTRGLVHGALTPGNILIDGHEHLWVADFGLARLHPVPAPYLAPELHAVTRVSIQRNTMAPLWDAVTPASDQYMLGMLCKQIFARLLRPADYEHLQPILQCATNPKPAQRFASMDIFMHELANQETRNNAPANMRNGKYTQNLTMPMLLPGGKPPQPTKAEQELYDKTVKYNLAASMPQSPTDDWEKLGGKLFTQRDYEGAVKAYRHALELDAHHATSWLALGDAYFALENHREALGAYERATQLNPDDPQGWSNRGTVLDALGRRKEALECYERADQLNI